MDKNSNLEEIISKHPSYYNFPLLAKFFKNVFTLANAKASKIFK